MNRCVRHGNAALSHHRHEISIAQSVGNVPADAQLDDLPIEATTSVNGISDNRPGHLGTSSMPTAKSPRASLAQSRNQNLYGRDRTVTFGIMFVGDCGIKDEAKLLELAYPYGQSTHLRGMPDLILCPCSS